MIGERIQRVRRMRNLSLSELARRAGVSKSYVSTLENGKGKRPGVDKLGAIARALNVPLDILIDGDSHTRLLAIAQAHRKEVDMHGGVSGYCPECQLVWPCPTYRWATQPEVTSVCAWDLDDCECDNDHRVPL